MIKQTEERKAGEKTKEQLLAMLDQVAEDKLTNCSGMISSRLPRKNVILIFALKDQRQEQTESRMIKDLINLLTKRLDR